MENYNQEIREILHRQQIMEYCKKSLQNTAISHDPYAARITARCRRRNTLAEQFKTVLAYIFIAFIALTALLYLLYIPVKDKPVMTDSTKVPSITDFIPPPEETKAAMEAGDYDSPHYPGR